MAKDSSRKSRPPKAPTAMQRELRKRRAREALQWETSRYEWLCGPRPMPVVIVTPAPAPAPAATAPTPRPQERKRPQSDRVWQSMKRVFPGGVTDAVKTAAAVRAIITDLRTENKRRGIDLPDPSRPAIERVLGRRRPLK
jgi:hypothetical protein